MPIKIAVMRCIFFIVLNWLSRYIQERLELLYTVYNKVFTLHILLGKLLPAFTVLPDPSAEFVQLHYNHF